MSFDSYPCFNKFAYASSSNLFTYSAIAYLLNRGVRAVCQPYIGVLLFAGGLGGDLQCMFRLIYNNIIVVVVFFSLLLLLLFVCKVIIII